MSTSDVHPWVAGVLRDASALLAAARIGAGDPEVLYAVTAALEATETALRAYAEPAPTMVQRFRRVELEEPVRPKFDPERARRAAAEAL